MTKPNQSLKSQRAWQRRYYEPLAPKVGDVAPDFELRDVNGENAVHLSDFRGKKTGGSGLRELHLTALCQGGREPP